MTAFAEFRIEVGTPIQLGDDGFGQARIVPILGGTVTGETLSGVILPGGADEQRIRSDGLTRIHARYVIRSRDGDLVQVDSQGLRHTLTTGDPPDIYFRTVIRFQTASTGLEDLNRWLYLSDGRRAADHVILTLTRL